MQLTLTVVDPATAERHDVLLVAEPDDTVASVAASLAEAVRGVPVGVGGGGSVIALRPPPSAGLLHVDGEPVDPTLTLRASPLREGAVISLDGPEGCLLPEPDGLVEVRVVSGPGAGTVARLGPGTAVAGTAPGCAISLHGSDVPALGLRLDVGLDGSVTVCVQDGVTARLDGVELTEQPLAWPPGAMVRLGSALLSLAVPERPDAALEPSEDGVGLDYNRPPRLRPPVRTTRFRLPKTPAPPQKRPLPWLMALMPMVMAVAMAFLFKRYYYLLFGILSPITFVGNAMMDRKNGRRSHRRDLAEFRERRAAVEAAATAALTTERDARRFDCPDPAALLLTATGPRRRLWERRRHDADLLLLRLGSADLPSDVELEDPERPDHDRTVAWTAYDVPVAVPLAQRGVLGLAGPGDVPRRLARWLVGQAAVLHSPQDLRIVVLTEPAARNDWDWVRWLPHCRPADGQDTATLLGTDTETVARRLAELSALVTARTRASVELGLKGELDEASYVVVLDGARRLRSLPGVVTLLRDGPRVGVLLICLDADERLLPEECQAVAVWEGTTADSGTLRVQQADSDPVSGVRADDVPLSWANRLARSLAPVRDVGQGSDDAAIPSSSRLLDVLQIEPPEPNALAARWALSGRSTSAVVGESLDGPFAIDIVRDGPHGLIAGTTGAGKSELLQTMVATLAVANRPDEMTFVLIDYKGGSAFKDCERLPHTVGMVTDLDTHLVERALASLSAELKRREHMLADSGAKDIEDYLDVRARGGDVLAPLPRLLLVIDEFASMVRELPDFVTGLVNIAQRGRSLGIHLMLATQRPSGVVTPEIRANTNLRIALRVTDKSESSDVIDAPDSANISKSTPGRAYVRLGASSLVPFQSGRVGGRRPGAKVVSSVGPWVAALEWPRLGAPLPRRPRDEQGQEEEITDLSVLVDALTEAAVIAGVPSQPSPWLQALGESVLLADLPPVGAGQGSLAPIPYAIEDLPAEQVQRATALDLATFTHLLVCGAARSGRSQLLRTIAASAAQLHSTADVHLFGIDCGNGALLPLTALPHCGAVVTRSQAERAVRLITRLSSEVEHRQGILGDSGYADLTEQRRGAEPADRLPHLLVLLDRWEGWTTTLGEIDGGRLTDALMVILREGASVGIHMIITGDRSLLSGRISATTEDKLALRLADRMDYTLLGLSPKKLPDEPPPGRAYRAESAIETQVALLDADPSGQGQARAISVIAEAAVERDADVPRARRPFRVDVLPAQLSFDQAWEHRDGTPAPLFGLVGVGGDELVALGPDLAGSSPTFVVAGPGKSGRSTVLLTMAASLLRSGSGLVVCAPKASPLRGLADRDGVLACFTEADVTTAELEAALAAAGDRPVTIVIDDGELLKDCDAKDVLRGIVKGLSGPGKAIVLGGSADDIGSGFSGWQVDARKNRCGALLSPQGMSDGDLVGVRLPRSSIGGPLTPGRAIVHLGDGQLTTVQVPLTTATD